MSSVELIDIHFDFKSCPAYEPVEHHHGFCIEDDMGLPECANCPAHLFHDLGGSKEAITKRLKEFLHKKYLKKRQVSPVRWARLTRKRFIQILGEHNQTIGLEIGVDRGTFSEYMFKNIPNLHLTGVDPWYWKLRGESRYRSTLKKMAPYNMTIIRKTSREAADDIEDGSLDYLHIDGDHTFDFVMTDLILFVPKVKEGGVISGHDYYGFTRAGVIPAVNVFTQQHMVHEWFITDEKTPTYFWVREPTFVDPLPEQD